MFWFYFLTAQTKPKASSLLMRSEDRLSFLCLCLSTHPPNRYPSSICLNLTRQLPSLLWNWRSLLKPCSHCSVNGSQENLKESSLLICSLESLCLAPYIRPLIFGFSNKVSGTGGRMFNAWWGLIWLYCLSQTLIATCACRVVWNHSALRTSFRKVPLKRSLYPFSQGLPG